MNEFDIFNFFQQFNVTKEEITRLYVEGKITKEEFIKRMDKCLK